MKLPLWLAVLLIAFSGSMVHGQENSDGALKSAFENLKKAIGTNGKGSAQQRFNGVKTGGTPATLYSCLAEVPSRPPLSKDDLANQRNWQPLNPPALKDQSGHVWQTALYGLSASGQAPIEYRGFVCILSRWLESGESPSNEGIIPESVRLSEDGENAYFVRRHPSNRNFDDFCGVSRENVFRAKTGTGLHTATWVRANPTHANMMVVDYPRGIDPNSPRVSDALDELEKMGLMGSLVFKNKALRESLAKIISQKLRDDKGKAEDPDIQ